MRGYMNVEEFLDMYRKHMITKEGEDFAIIGLPFFHLGHPDGIALRFNYQHGQLSISDCHTTIDYLEDNDIDLDDYQDKLAAIMRRFNVFLDGNVFRKIIYDADNHINLCTGIGYFIEAISLIAHIDL